MTSENKKFCRKCKQWIVLSLVKKSNRRLDGYASICKACNVQETLIKRKKDKTLPKKENPEYLIKYCSKHGDLKYEDIGLNIYQNTNPIVVDLVCLKCCKFRTSKKYNNDNMIENMKKENIICYICSFSYSINNFYKSELKRKSPSCIKCLKTRQQPHKEKSRFKRNFKLTIDQYNKILINQNYVCAICEKKEDKIHRITKEITRLSVDHCHKTGKIRGLLCRRCNLMLGNALDSIEILKKGISYLEC
jgi:hypothetical protein